MSSIQAGDVVVCVDDSAIRHADHIHPARHSVRGRTYRVLGVGVDCHGCPSAHLSGGLFAFLPRFRKIEKADDKDFIAQIKACRPKQRDRVSS